jgi:hypothetical protein
MDDPAALPVFELHRAEAVTDPTIDVGERTGRVPASFTPASRSQALRFTSLAVTSLREDFHLQVDAHAGRTNKTAGREPGRLLK